MATLPLVRVRIWPAGVEPDPELAPSIVLKIDSGDIAWDAFDATREFGFLVSHDHHYTPDDYSSVKNNLEGGAWIEAMTSLNGFFGATDPTKTWFWGTLNEYNLDRQHDDTYGKASVDGNYKAYDPLNCKKSLGVNRNWSSRMKIYTGTFDSSDFIAEPGTGNMHFIVQLPDMPFPNDDLDWVENGMITLVAHHIGGSPTEKDYLIDYSRDEYAYSSGLKQIYFKSSQEEPFKDVPKAEYEWTFTLYYYDPADVDHTVNMLLESIYTGQPDSEAGGLGFDAAQLDFDTIVSFDGVSPKKVRSFTWTKENGPVVRLEDKLREDGLIPVDYYIYYDPHPDGVTGLRMIRGRHLFQDNGTVATLANVVREDMPFSVASLTLRAECWAPAISPQNFALPASVTLNKPAGYTTIPAVEADAKDGLHDNKTDTICIVQKKVTTLNYQVVRTGPDFIVLDLLQTRYVDEINLRYSSPKAEKGGEFIEQPTYLVSRQAKVSVSLSDDIGVDSIGVPVNPDAIANIATLLTIDDYADHSYKCTLKRSGRYVLIRGDQDAFYRIDGNKIGATARQSGWHFSEIRVLGDGLYRYPDADPDAGACAYAQITWKGDVVGAVNLVAKTFTVSAQEAGKFSPGDLIEFFDTSADARFDGYFTIDTIVGTTIKTLEALPGALVNGDQMGPRKRWMLGLPGDWVDLKAEKLYWKVWNTTKRIELVTDQFPSSLGEAEQFCVERLLELNRSWRDYEAELLLNHTDTIGHTRRTRVNAKAWLVTRLGVHFHPYNVDPRALSCTLQLSGDNREEDMQ